jgi:hypothetical protein
MGAMDLVVGVNHKPLVGLYAEDKALADIENPRLRNLAKKARRYWLKTFHIPGVMNNIPDSLWGSLSISTSRARAAGS